jgi:hypothetical protein
MRPEIADFIRIIYGNRYKDHEEVTKYPNVKGI